MKGEDCKVPISEDRKSFLHKQEINSSGGKKVAIITALLLLIATAVMTAFTFQSLNGISELRQEVEDLKTAIKVLQGKIDKNDDDQHKSTTSTSTIPDDDYNNNANYDEYPDEDYDEYSDEPVNTVPFTGDQFTKDADVATAPPRLKRSIIGYGQDGTPIINSESDNEIRRRNSTRRNHFSTLTPPSSYSYQFYPELTRQDPTSPGPKHLHSKRLHVHHNDNSQSTTTDLHSLLKSAIVENPEDQSNAGFTVVRGDHTRHRQRRIVPGRMRPLPSAHFSGDTSKYVLGYHENFKGNGHLRHPQRTFVDWAEKPWFRSLGMDRYFSFSDGYLTIKDAGLYFIYAQIFYYDVHDVSGFRVYRNENETLLQCTTTSHSTESVLKGNTCFTAAAEYLNENDRISVEDLQSRYSLFEPGKSFFGVIQIGDVKIK